MTLTQMRYFYEVCKWRSITKAAASLHISQPTVSIAMADLEKESRAEPFSAAKAKNFRLQKTAACC